jgi:hypothetical protein
MGNSVEYALQEPVQYANKGEMVEAMFVTLNPPTSRNMTECAQLKQAFFRALPKTGEIEAEASDGGQAELTGEAVMTMITMSPDVELASVLVTGRELLTSGLALIDGEEKLTKPVLDNMSADDLEGMIGEYLVNFILASALRKMKTS